MYIEDNPLWLGVIFLAVWVACVVGAALSFGPTVGVWAVFLPMGLVVVAGVVWVARASTDDRW